MRSALLPLVAVGCAALLAGGAVWLLREDGVPSGTTQAAVPGARPEPVREAPRPSEVHDVLPVATPVAGGSTETTVAWPVEVELELLEPAERLRGEGVDPLGSGRSARLRGQVTVGDRVGVPATLRFVAGLNEGRTLTTNEQGYFGARDLYPGVSLVRIDGPGIAGSLREVRLLRDKESLLAIDYGAPGSVGGVVFGLGGEPMEGVEVELDGRRGTTDAQGVFRFAGVPGGSDVALVLRAKGFATQYHTIGVAAARAIEPTHYRFTMELGGSLEVSIVRSAGEPGPARVLLETALNDVQQPYAWHLLGPYELMPGSSLLLEDLPPTRIVVRVEHAGARANPPQATAVVRPNHVERTSFELEPAPTLAGRVVDAEGLAVPEARVRLEAPDRASATFGHLRVLPGHFELNFHPSYGPALSETTSDHQGAFHFTVWPEQVPTAYLVAESRDGSLRGGRAVRVDAGEVELVLHPAQEGRARLELDFGGRTQGLPVQVSVDGELRPEVVLGVDEPLAIDGLAPGRWRLHARWNGEYLLGGSGSMEFELDGTERRSLTLPQGAILGQDRDTLERARG